MPARLSIRTLTERRRRLAPDMSRLHSTNAKLMHANKALRKKNAILAACIANLLTQISRAK